MMMMMENIVLYSKQGRNDMKMQNTPQKFLNNKETVRIEDCLKKYYMSQWDY